MNISTKFGISPSPPPATSTHIPPSRVHLNHVQFCPDQLSPVQSNPVSSRQAQPRPVQSSSVLPSRVERSRNVGRRAELSDVATCLCESMGCRDGVWWMSFMCKGVEDGGARGVTSGSGRGVRNSVCCWWMIPWLVPPVELLFAGSIAISCLLGAVVSCSRHRASESETVHCMSVVCSHVCNSSAVQTTLALWSVCTYEAEVCSDMRADVATPLAPRRLKNNGRTLMVHLRRGSISEGSVRQISLVPPKQDLFKEYIEARVLS